MAQIGTKGAELDLLIRQGATFGPVTSTLTNPDDSPIDLTGAIIRAQIRKTASSSIERGCVISFDIIDAANGVFQWYLDAQTTANLHADNESEDAPASMYVWDMELEDSIGRILPLIYGKVRVFREVTRGV